MRKLRCGIIGFGFVGPHHLDAIRRLGFVEVKAICTQNAGEAREKAARFHIAEAWDDYHKLLDDPEIEVIDVATPTHLHHPIALAALAKGKHVIVDKPMSLSAGQAFEMFQAARQAGRLGAVTFNIRYNPVLQQARLMVTQGELGAVHLIQGHYLQEWLLRDTDFSWRLDPEKSGPTAMVAEAGAHWFDLSQHISGLDIVRLRADLSTTLKIRKRPSSGQTQTFAADAGRGGQDYSVTVPDLGFVLMEYSNGARGVFTTTAMCAGRKNDLRIELNGAQGSLEWRQEHPNELWVGRRDKPNAIVLKDPNLFDASIRGYAALPGGHNEGWSDAFRNVMRSIFTFIAEGRDPATADEVAFPTFLTGYRINCITDAIEQSRVAGGAWVDVDRHVPN